MTSGSSWPSSSRGSGGTRASSTPRPPGCSCPSSTRAAGKAWSARLFYAYAEALLALGDRAGAREWFGYAVDADEALETDAAERVDELDGVEQLDLLGDDDE